MPRIQLDAIDRKILACLQANGRLSNVELADAVGLSPSPCLRRVRALEEVGIIYRYAALLEQGLVGLPMTIFVQVSLERQTEEYLEKFERAIQKCPEVMECYLMTGGSDYHLRLAMPDLQTYEHFLKSTLTRIPGVANIRSSFAIKQVSYTTVLPLNAV